MNTTNPATPATPAEIEICRELLAILPGGPAPEFSPDSTLEIRLERDSAYRQVNGYAPSQLEDLGRQSRGTAAEADLSGLRMRSNERANNELKARSLQIQNVARKLNWPVQAEEQPDGSIKISRDRRT